MTIITKSYLEQLFLDERLAERAIGRALVVLFNNQNSDEKVVNRANARNGRGFTPADARRGCITAKYFLKHNKLEPWMIDYWHDRLPKYHAQLTAAAR